MDTELDTRLRAELDRRRGDWPRISKAADVSHSWVSQFVRGKIPNPGYATLKRIQSALHSSTELIGAEGAPSAAEAGEGAHG